MLVPLLAICIAAGTGSDAGRRTAGESRAASPLCELVNVLERARRIDAVAFLDSAGVPVLTVRAERISDDYMKPRDP